MKPGLTLLFSLFFSFAWSQIAIKGELRLGDTTQVHILKTNDGSRLTGRVIGFDQTQLTFLFKNQNTLVFQLSEVESIEILGAEAIPKETPGNTASGTFPHIYTVTTLRGEKHTGKLTRALASGLRLQKDASGSTRFFYWNEIKSLNYAGPDVKNPGQEIHVLYTYRGDRFTGHVLGYESNTLEFILENGAVLKFSTKDLRKIEFLEHPDKGTMSDISDEIPMRGQERAYFSPSAFLLKKGQGEFRTVILNNSIDYGISDNFTVGGSFASVLVASLGSIKMKFGASLSEYVHVAAGPQLYGALVIDGETGWAALAFGSLTLGTPERFLSISVGRGTSIDAAGGTSGIGGNASVRVGRNFRLYGEYFSFLDSFNDNYNFAIAGGSWFNKNHCVDFGMALFPLDFDVNIPLPLISYSYRF